MRNTTAGIKAEIVCKSTKFFWIKQQNSLILLFRA